MRMGIAMSLVGSLLLGANSLLHAAPQNAAVLEGTWILSTGEADGKTLAEKQIQDGKLVIKGEQYTVTLPGGGTVKGMQKLDSKTIDITDASGPNQGKTCLGIYELKGDEFRVAFAVPGKARPTKFATSPESGQWVHVWKRVKE